MCYRQNYFTYFKAGLHIVNCFEQNKLGKNIILGFGIPTGSKE